MNVCVRLLALFSLGLVVACSSDNGDDPVDAGADDTGVDDTELGAEDDTREDPDPDTYSHDPEVETDTGTVDTGPDVIEVPAPGPLTFGSMGPLTGDEGRGSFVFGAASAATQIEDQNPHTDWYAWTAPEPDGLGNGTFVDEAVRGYTMALEDVALVDDAGLDVYRFSLSWSRIEPERDVINEEGLAHYDAVLDALVAQGTRPMVTIHHFSAPTWVDDPRQDPCPDEGPSDTHLCGWGDPVGGPLVIEELAEHAALVAARYGDRVDDWTTFNEPVNYLLAAYGTAVFPPGRTFYLDDIDRFIDVVRDVLAANAAVYDAIKAADTIDADGDGVAANVGITLSVAEWAPAFRNAPSTREQDLAAVERVQYLYHYLFVQSILDGTFDADFDGSPDEAHPDWAGKIDYLGVQYYFRAGVTGQPVFPLVDAVVCFGGFDLGSCLDPADPTHWVDTMHYEFYEPGLYNVLSAFGERWPELPLIVSENGIATTNGDRRAEVIVRELEQIARALDEGVDVRGYLYWSLTDNFEWAEGYEPQFGLYAVDRETFERTPTAAVPVLRELSTGRVVTEALREAHGGLGPMSEE